MKSRLVLWVLCIFALLCSTERAKSENILESWYTCWGIGYADVSYPKELDEMLDMLKDMPDVTQMGISMDLLGFYWPRGERTILGVIVNGWGDRYEVNGEYMQMNGYLYSASMMRFLNKRIGQGLFVRGDVGGAKLVVDSSGAGMSSSEWGYGALIGGGYGIPISKGTRLLINANYSFRQVEGETYGSFQLSLAGLF